MIGHSISQEHKMLEKVKEIDKKAKLNLGM